MIYNLSRNVVNDAKMLMRCQTSHLYKLTVGLSQYSSALCEM